MLAAIRAGMDPALAAGQTRKIQAEIADARSTIHEWERTHITTAPLSECEVRDVLTATGGLVAVLAGADRTERAALYGALGLTLRYENKLQPARNASTSGWSHLVAGAGC